MDHLRYSGLPFERQREVFIEILAKDKLVSVALERARTLSLPNWRVVSGVLYQSIWNRLTRRPSGHGIKDIDLFYFDRSDLSYAAEDAVIAESSKSFDDLPVPVEIRNEARVHLWYENKFGLKYPPLGSCEEAIDRFTTETHCVGICVDAEGAWDLYAPFGLDHIFSFALVPNRILPNRVAYYEKAERAKAVWPELSVEPW